MSSSSGETGSRLISSLDADSSGRPPDIPNSPVMGPVPSNQVSSQSIIASLSESVRVDGLSPSQPREINFNGRPSNEAGSSMTASPSGGRGDDPLFGLAYERSHNEQ